MHLTKQVGRLVPAIFAAVLVSAALVAPGCTDDEGSPGSDASGAGGGGGGGGGAGADGDSAVEWDGGDDSGGATDGGEPEPGTLGAPVLGRVEIGSMGWGGEYSDEGTVGAQFFDGKMRVMAGASFPPGVYREAVRGGDCLLLLPSEGACNPPCGADQYCNAASVCERYPATATAGEIAVKAPGSNLTLAPEQDGLYPSVPLPAAGISSSSAFEAIAAGDALPAFSLEVQGVDQPSFDIDLMANSITLEDGGDNRVTWTPTAGGGIVQLLINKGWHGAPPEATLICEADDDRGEIVIPQAMVEAFPSTGGGIGEPHASHIALLRRDRASVDGGAIELVVSYRHGLYPRHNDQGGLFE